MLHAPCSMLDIEIEAKTFGFDAEIRGTGSRP
jgi:hypothetical protein